MEPLVEYRSMLQCKPSQRIRAFDIQLAAHVRAVIFHRAVVNRKLIADLFAGKSIRN